MMVYAFGAALVCFAAWFYLRRKKSSPRSKSPRVWLLLGSGTAWSMRQVERKDFMLHDGAAQYPIAECMRVDCDGFDNIYMFGAEGVHLANYQMFSTLMKANIKGAIFKPAGDLVTMLQTVGAILVIAAAINSYWQTSGITATMVKQQTMLDKITDTLSKPLIVQK